ncbi:MAG TPA: polysaccharide deacetylase family protein, partial [Bacteroidia bacterium]|nr:polysaccharide deacetylase family protein [Bacteroidia bacterium]
MKKIVFSFLYNTLLTKNVILPFKKGIRYIFLFHDVSDPLNLHHNQVYSTDLEIFKDNIEWIQNHFKIVDLDRLTDKLYHDENNSNLASVVFDDGFYSVLEHAFPYLNKKEIPFAIFANKTAMQQNWLWCSNLIMAKKRNNNKYLKKIFESIVDNDKLSYERFIYDPITFICESKMHDDDYEVFREPEYEDGKVYLDEKDIKFLVSEGVIIGNHTKTHKHLSTCSDETIRQEIIDNKEYLKNLLGSEIKHFAIPFGFHTTYNDYAIKIAYEAHSFVYDTTRNYVKFSNQ